jgi:hypothetical protein
VGTALTASVVSYAVLHRRVPSELVVIDGTDSTAPRKVVVADPWMLDAVTSNRNTPVALGDPTSAPVAELSVTPAGSSPADTANVGAGYPVAVTVADGDDPTIINVGRPVGLPGLVPGVADAVPDAIDHPAALRAWTVKL